MSWTEKHAELMEKISKGKMPDTATHGLTGAGVGAASVPALMALLARHGEMPSARHLLAGSLMGGLAGGTVGTTLGTIRSHGRGK